MPSNTRYIGPPHASSGDVSKELSELMRNRHCNRTWMISTVSEKLSLSRIAPGLRDIRFRDGRTEAIVTTVPGGSGGENLLHTIKLVEEPYVFMRPSAHLTGAYFYVVQGDEWATVAIGPPGFFKEGCTDVHESAYMFDLDLTDSDDAAILKSLRDHFDALIATREECRPLTEDLVPDVVSISDRPVLPPRARRATGEQSGVPAFFKRLSKNDVSWKDSPGQIIIPRDFYSFFDELNVRHDQSVGGGPRQRHRVFPVTFVDHGDVLEIESARAVLYVPAENHPRRNPEMRFSFRSSEVLGRLEAGDYLVFDRNDEDHIVVERHTSDWQPPGDTIVKRFGVIAA